MTGPLPVSSYRIQLTVEYGFDDVIGLLDHLWALGISHVYLSPVTEAVVGSGHGYDVVDHTRVRDELGGREGLDRLLVAAAERGLRVIIDHVPNHCSTSRPELNPRWWTMLRDGPDSPAAAWFDVDRDHPGSGGRVLLPVLGAPLDDVLSQGEIIVAPADELVSEPHLLVHGGLRLPLAPATVHALRPDGADAVGRDLRGLLDAQHYELRFWRDVDRNVRRFFTIDDLVAVRVEDAAVAEVVDTVPARLADHPGFGGVRVDHVDGLADPLGYLTGLRGRIGSDAWLLVEKILATDEWLPASWPVDGTTGYELARILDQVMLRPEAELTLDGLWAMALEGVDDARVQGAYHEVEDLARREVLAEGLAPDVERAVRAMVVALGVDPADGEGQDAGDRVRDALVELTVQLPRYRTYLPDDPAGAEVLRSVAAAVVAGRPELGGFLDRIVEVLLDARDDPQRLARTRWQQLSGPAMAKGAEDRAFYRYLRWAALCEVGGDPGRFGASVEEFHAHMVLVAERWPRTMLTVSTHDTKRAADVRARAAALAADHTAWAQAVRGWMPIIHELEPAIRRTTILHALQTVVTCPGLDVDRLTAFLVKSAREAELRTAWTEVDPDHEDRLRRLAEMLLGEHEVADSVAVWADRLERPGIAAAVVATILRATVPGVPDTYQGTEVLSYRLVDPDNRVAPDWPAVRAVVGAAGQLDLRQAWRDRADATKAVVMRRVAALRRRHTEAFAGGYRAVPVAGAEADRVIAFVRGPEQVLVVVALPGAQFVAAGEGGPAVQLPPGRWCHVLVDGAEPIEGDSVAVVDLLAGLPGAVLERR